MVEMIGVALSNMWEVDIIFLWDEFALLILNRAQHDIVIIMTGFCTLVKVYSKLYFTSTARIFVSQRKGYCHHFLIHCGLWYTELYLYEKKHVLKCVLHYNHRIERWIQQMEKHK